MVRAAVLAALCFGAGCKSESGADPAEVETPTTPAKGSAGGFSASMSAELGSGTKPTAKAGAGSASAGSASAGSATAKAGSAAPSAGSGSAATPTAMAGSAAKAGSAAPSAGSGSAATPTAMAGSAAKPVGAGSGSAVVVMAPPKPKPVMTPELAAIKLALLANWDRDTVEAGSISLYEKNTKATFTFNYGYDDPKAPADREAYKKFLAESGTLTVKLDRQSGAAWYLEGNDANGRASFRILVTYGGRRLICGGSLYKEAGVDRDLRDSVLIQAKQICESIQL